MVTLAGDTEALETVVEALEEKGTFVRWLLIDYAFHTYQMDPIKDELLESLAHIAPRKSKVPFVSTVTAGVINGEELDAGYWWGNVRNPVRFSEAVRTILDAGDEFFLELGPHPIHSGAIKECLTQAGLKGTAIASLRRQEPERASMLEAAGYLYSVGYPVKWTTLQREVPEFVRLPSYPWNHESFWLESEESRAQRLAPLVHPFLGVRLSSPKPTWNASSIRVPSVISRSTGFGFDGLSRGPVLRRSVWRWQGALFRRLLCGRGYQGREGSLLFREQCADIAYHFR